METYNLLLTCVLIVFVFLLLSLLSFKNYIDKYFKQVNKNYIITPLILIGITLIIISFFSPYYFTKKQIGDTLVFDEKTGWTGDTLGGIMNPFIALAGAVFTFIAFYIQKIANDDIKNQFKIQQFESQFYEMLRFHKDNVNSLYLTIKKKIVYPKSEEIIESSVQGKIVFEYMKIELSVIYMIAIKNFVDKTPKNLLNESYAIFFNGISETYRGKHTFFDEILELESYFDNFDFDNFNKKMRDGLNFNKDIIKMLEFPLFKGHAHQLAHYYRHLFQTVKFIANQDENFISYEKKRNYLRILRSQLSNTEQTLLFYNWYSKFGKQWEDNKNKFFTDYRMIHNLFNELLISHFKLEDIFDLDNGYRKEEDRESDSLFEFQDWG
ncbi:putative phage abortive infection protein [Flavobacterium tibetense]|uniref:Phage abortive infection protein n=1 Tax=Flavobacterium tibetense TaxID=2233533 RepID=A0A365NZ33_9FLAO|nr:putative phage abortive infection protein [Flavobacterium tibetense]RBA27451.1 hypothetical protein DPN68_12060 [Flavobacterium tibetense]